MTTLLEDKLMQDFVEKSSDQIVKIVKPLNDRIAALEDVVRELVAECKHLHEFAILKGGCDDEPCRTQAITAKALELVNQNQGGK